MTKPEIIRKINRDRVEKLRPVLSKKEKEVISHLLCAGRIHFCADINNH